MMMIGGGALLLTIIKAFCCSGWGCQACREIGKRRSKKKGLKGEKVEQPEVIEIKVEQDRPRDRELESALFKLKSKMGKVERKETTLLDRGGGRSVFAMEDGLKF